MPSVRVKRNQYAHIDELSSEDPHGRPRSHSVSQSYNQEAGPPQVQPPNVRRRSHTVSGLGGYPPRRPTSRVSDHIMATCHTPRLESAQLSNNTQRSRIGRARSATESGLRPISDAPDVISLQGSSENIVYHGDAQHMGRIGSAFSLEDEDDQEHHHDDIVEHLEVIDPAIATVSTLTNAANAIVFPPLSFYSRRPTIVLPDIPRNELSDAEKATMHEDNLDRHVQDVLSKRDQWRRIMKGVWAFMKTPMGIIVTFYGFNVVFWGAGIVFFLGKLYDFHNKNTQDFWVEVCQQVETGLFTATSIGLIPFRVLDTWRIGRIFHWQRITLQRRRKAGLPDLYDKHDLPDPAYDSNYVHVLSEKEQADLHYQQHKFMQSMTWYRPHGTSTHRAFPIDLALWICIMNGLNSFFQCLLSACMWSMDRFQRPAWTTATTLPAAFIAGILAGVFIWWGGKKTRRHEQVEKRLRAALAMENPAIIITEPPETAGPTGSENDGTPESRTVSSSPTLSSHDAPRRKDFSDTIQEEDNEYTCGADNSEERSTRPTATSFGSTQVPIVEHMTVPPVEALDEHSYDQRL